MYAYIGLYLKLHESNIFALKSGNLIIHHLGISGPKILMKNNRVCVLGWDLVQSYMKAVSLP